MNFTAYYKSIIKKDCFFFFLTPFFYVFHYNECLFWPPAVTRFLNWNGIIAYSICRLGHVTGFTIPSVVRNY